jgi:hypothetical protein
MTSEASDDDGTYPAFLWPDVKFKNSFKANPLYPSSMELDFILCFRYIKDVYDPEDQEDKNNKFATGSKEGLLASAGVLQA